MTLSAVRASGSAECHLDLKQSGKMVAMLLSDRHHWEQLLSDPSLVRTAVEETLRLDTNSGFGMVRYLDEDVNVPEGRIPSGTTVVCSMASANRDERVFDHPAEMDLARTPNPHLAFGTGPHSCLVRPSTGHVAELGSPTWYARFIAQCTTDPGLRQLIS
jgi:cytochrome P450